MSKKTETAAAVTLAKGDTRARLIVEVGELVLAAGIHARDGKSIRAKLGPMVARIFAKPVTVAEAAEVLDLNLSTRGDDYTDSEKAAIQNARVALGRALDDAGLRKKNPGKGRKASTSKDATGDNGKAAELVKEVTTAKGKKELVEVMLGNLANLTDAGLERLMNGIVAERQSRKADGKPARKVKKA